MNIVFWGAGGWYKWIFRAGEIRYSPCGGTDAGAAERLVSGSGSSVRHRARDGGIFHLVFDIAHNTCNSVNVAAYCISVE